MAPSKLHSSRNEMRKNAFQARIRLGLDG